MSISRGDVLIQRRRSTAYLNVLALGNGITNSRISCSLKLFDGSSYIENFEGFQVERALWDIVVSDRTIAFQGLAVGMTEAEAESVLPDQGWTYDSEYSDPDNDEELLCFTLLPDTIKG